MNDIERGDYIEALGTESLLFRRLGNIVHACGDVGVYAGTRSGVGESNRDVADDILADDVVFSAQNLGKIVRQRSGTFETTSNQLEG